MTDVARALAVAILIAMECGGNLSKYLVAYQDGGGVWTLGVGSTYMPGGRRVTRGDAVTYAEALALLERQIDVWFAVIQRVTKVPLTDAWIAVLVSFVHQMGVNALPGSVLIDMLNAGLTSRAARQLNGWVIATAGGVRGPQLGIMRRMEVQRQIALGASLEPTRTQVWAYGTVQLLPLYIAACADATQYRNGTVTWEAHQVDPSASSVRPWAPQSEADRLMDQFNPTPNLEA